MDYEKKYKEALERARICHKDMSNLDGVTANMAKDFFEEVFPELCESEDERIREALICGMYALKEQHKTCFASIPIDNAIAWLEKQGEQKPIDKVEPKSNIEKGKWYVCDTSRYTDFVVGKAYFCPKNGMLKPNENEIARYVAKDCFHLWTIQDAKDGDVLAESKGDVILMFRGIGNARWDDVIDYHFYYDCYRENFIVQEDVNYWGNTENNQLKPATKEQRDLLFQKMKEASYEWDFEKKELKKIEQNLAWSEEDEEMFEKILQQFMTANNDCKLNNASFTYDKEISFLKSLKERYTWKPIYKD